jgi:hypothetical protein
LVPSFLLFLLLQAHSQSTFAPRLLLLLQLITDPVPLLFLSLVGGIFGKEHIKNAFRISSNCFKKCVFIIAGVASSLIPQDLKSQILKNAVPNDWLSAFSFKNARF